jgi:hypothetical protein
MEWPRGAEHIDHGNIDHRVSRGPDQTARVRALEVRTDPVEVHSRPRAEYDHRAAAENDRLVSVCGLCEVPPVAALIVKRDNAASGPHAKRRERGHV